MLPSGLLIKEGPAHCLKEQGKSPGFEDHWSTLLTSFLSVLSHCSEEQAEQSHMVLGGNQEPGAGSHEPSCRRLLSSASLTSPPSFSAALRFWELLSQAFHRCSFLFVPHIHWGGPAKEQVRQTSMGCSPGCIYPRALDPSKDTYVVLLPERMALD